MKLFSKLEKTAVGLFAAGLVFLSSQTIFAQETTSFGADFSPETVVSETKSDTKPIEMRLDISEQIAADNETIAPKDEFAYRFKKTAEREKHSDLKDSFEREWQSREFDFNDSKQKAEKNAAVSLDDGFQWKPAIAQSLIFLAVQHGYAIGFQEKTREALRRGAFWKDYAKSVKSLHGWDDGGRFFTNYIAHPMQGALTGHIYVQNSPRERQLKFGSSGDYWRSRMKAFLWSTAWSTQFEIGPISQASIGNVGLKGKQTWEDIVVTPTMGTAMLVAEDALDRYINERVERKNNNFYVKVFLRMLLNPTRNFSNMLRLKEPWYRDR